MKTVLAVRHVHFEDLGTLEPVLHARGYRVEYREAGLDDLPAREDRADLVVLLGAPIGAYEEDKYPFLLHELEIATHRLREDRPLLGICLGAQIMARALGANVHPGGTKEIGWGEIALTRAGTESSLAALAQTRVLHWHGDTFDLPEGAVRLASTPLYENQAFSWRRRCLAVQFHAEARQSNLERWYIGHAAEIAAANVTSVALLRSDARRFAPTLESRASSLWESWLSAIER